MNRRAGTLALAVLSLGGLAGSFVRAEAPSAIPPPGLVDDIRGVWMIMEEVAVDIAGCGHEGELCGRIVWLRAPRDAAGQPKRDEMNPLEVLQTRPLCGLTVLQGLRPTGPYAWGGGTFYDPRDGGTYRIRLTLGTADALVARVYVGVPLFGKSQLLVRVNRLTDDGWC